MIGIELISVICLIHKIVSDIANCIETLKHTQNSGHFHKNYLFIHNS